jgi:glycosyltransferase involved in cell wall biosynthesis
VQAQSAVPEGAHQAAELSYSELELAREQLRALTRERNALEAERASSEARRKLSERRASELERQWSELERSLGWLLIQHARRVRRSLFREGTLRGRCWSVFAGFIKTARRSGIRAAIQKFIGKVDHRMPGAHRKRGRLRWGLAAANDAIERFRAFPWTYTGATDFSPDGDGAKLKILLVSHSAGRTGAPLCLLRVAQELARRPDVEVWSIFQRGGDLIDSFAAVIPTLEIDDLVAEGVNPHDAPLLIATAFHEFSNRGIVICNTTAVTAFHEALAARSVPVLSWIHELPTFVEAFGGRSAINQVKSASRIIIVPSDAVRAALLTRYNIDPGRVRTVYNGQEPVTLGMAREAMRSRVRRELAIPDEALIVLGCGTVDLRKGTDLFVNVARKILTDPRHHNLAGRTWFIWAGHGSDEDLVRWLKHDSKIGAMGEQIRLIGPQTGMAPYYLAADVLALTSREDPCPLVNMEAMESGLPVVAFHDAGGAPEVLADAGVCVPYIDVEAMSRAICDLLGDPARRAELGKRGQLRIREQFTWVHFMDKLSAILAEHFGQFPAGGPQLSADVPHSLPRLMSKRHREPYRKCR